MKLNADFFKYNDMRNVFSKGVNHDPETSLPDTEALIKLYKHVFAKKPITSGDVFQNKRKGVSYTHYNEDLLEDFIAPPAHDTKAAINELIDVYAWAMNRDKKFTEIEGAPKDYISQFLLRDYSIGNQKYSNKVTEYKGNFLNDWDEFICVQNGQDPSGKIETGPQKYIETPRDLASMVHKDKDQQYRAAFFMMKQLNIRMNPFLCEDLVNEKQIHPFIYKDAPIVCKMLAEITHESLMAGWACKWAFCARIRPEAYGGLIEKDIGDKNAIDMFKEQMKDYYDLNKTWLLSTVYPEGSPLHPSYVAGHAIVALASTTLLKSWFDPRAEMPIMEVINGELKETDRVSTVGAELDKLALNIAFGRNMAGIHYNSDFFGAIKCATKLANKKLHENGFYGITQSFNTELAYTSIK